MNRTVCIDRIYPHAPEKVWRMLTDRRSLSQWMMPNNFTPRVGRTFQFRGVDRLGRCRVIDCRVVELDPLRRLAYTWRDRAGGPPTVVRWSLERAGGGTRVRLEHAEAARKPGEYPEAGAESVDEATPPLVPGVVPGEVPLLLAALERALVGREMCPATAA
jgi:uncharacterized protein YndB with AHSA1/START domain